MLWEYAHQDKSLTRQDLNDQGHLVSKMPAFYDAHVEPQFDDLYIEMAMRAMANVVPDLARLIGGLGPKDVHVDGGYYTYTSDDLPLVGPVEDLPGYHLASGVAGFGLLAAMGVGEAVCMGITGSTNDSAPAEYSALKPLRMCDPTYLQKIQERAGSAVGGSL